MPQSNSCLVVVDVQNDFLPGGALPTQGDGVIPVVNRLIDAFDHVVATQDWHPAGHSSFEIWPDHCVQGTQGAEFPPDLRADKFEAVFQKGNDPQIDSYSGFFDNEQERDTGLADFLDERGYTHIYVCGLATEYCVKFTALDGRGVGLEVSVITDACRPVDNEGRVAALLEMSAAGVELVTTEELIG